MTSNLTIQPYSHNVAFCGKMSNVNQIVKNIKHNNRVLFESPTVSGPYNYKTVGYVFAQLQNIGSLVSLPFRKIDLYITKKIASFINKK